MLARLIQTCYTGDYESAMSDRILPLMIKHALSGGRLHGIGDQGVAQRDSSACIVHAEMYALSDKYDVSSARTLAAAKFIARISTKAVPADEVLAATKVVYDTIVRNDETLRKHSVYYMQTNMLEVQKKSAFQELMADPDFAWDFGTRYGSRAHVWCSGCTDWTKISVNCGCGFNGLCALSEACTKQDWAVLKCARCKKSGQLLRDEPIDELITPSIEIAEATKNERTLTTPPPTPKKRKF